jgi:uncharacterized membrane protein
MKGVQDGRRDSAVSTRLVTMFLLSPGFEKNIVTLVIVVHEPAVLGLFSYRLYKSDLCSG